MRCATCGTENAPDSRFCGGCGARMPAAQSLVAPTQKISDDARYPNTAHTPTPVPQFAPGPASLPPSMPPASIPPQNGYQSGPHPHAPGPSSQPPLRGPSIPPANNPPPPSLAPSGSQPPRARASASVARRTSSPSLSQPAPRGRRWGLIILILLVDLALAGAGAYLLSEGLA